MTSIKISVPWKSTGHFRDLRIWLIDNIMKDCYCLEGVDFYNVNNRIVSFSNENDATLFSLRWS